MKKLFFLHLFLYIFNNSTSQILTGVILEAKSNSPVSFALVYCDKNKNSLSCDADGKFSIAISNCDSLHIRMLGYERKSIALQGINLNQKIIVSLKPDGIGLNEVVILPGENPAHKIIRKVIKNMPKYDIANYPFYSCNTYAKTYFTLSDKNGNENFYSEMKPNEMTKTLNRHYLFFIESVTEKKYNYKNKHQEKILASKVSGLKQSPFGAFATQLQSFTFYDENIELIGIKYLNPLIKGTFKRYNFYLKDTLLQDKDTILLISFQPKKKIHFKAMRGVLFINLKHHVLYKVQAEPAETEKNSAGIKIQQTYKQIDSTHWFPVQSNSELLMSSVNLSENQSDKSTVIKGVSKVYVNEINLDSIIRFKNKSVQIITDENAHSKDELFWQTHRVDSLNSKEKESYKVIDSIGKVANLDRKMIFLNTLINGKLPIGYFNLDLMHILRINQYEGARLGLGISTSDKISRWICIGGYGGYGFIDQQLKYGSFLRINLDKHKRNFMEAQVFSDIEESAGTFYFGENNSLMNTQKLRALLIEKMDKVNSAAFQIQLQPFAVLRTNAFLKVKERRSDFGFKKDSLPSAYKFVNNTAGIQLRFSPGEKYIENFGKLMPVQNKWPVIYLNLTKSIPEQIDVYQGEFDYSKIDLKINQVIQNKIRGYFSYEIQAGKVFGDVPYSYQYNNTGSRVKVFSLSIENTFETMFLNEFISSEYASIFLCWNSGKLFKAGSKFNPELELVHNYGIGNLNNKAQLRIVELNDMSKGYTEAGIRIKNLFKSNFSTFGVGCFYRYGNYEYEEPLQNLVVKLALGFAF
ncbi:MAG: carboxypeptidase-like regulatory domain-containing protein [Sphingobacteriaceae bacterium]|nr:carboxypeptidase-like regulatory domain-containing protein [Sphingobacteriaceae bacterium]